jgi:hypothetical protein
VRQQGAARAPLFDSPTQLHARARVNRRRKLLQKQPSVLTTSLPFIVKGSGQVVPANCLTPEIQATLDLAVDAFYNATGFVANVSDLYGCQSQVRASALLSRSAAKTCAWFRFLASRRGRE